MNSSSLPPPSETPQEFNGGAAAAAACLILGLSFLVGAPGNLLVIWTILKYVKQRSHTVTLILHLAVADLLVLITLPLWIYSLAHSWIFGEACCKAMVFLINACMYSSVFLITVMSVERFLAICHPFVMMRLKTRAAMNRCLVFLWLLALLLAVPAALTQTLEESDGIESCFFKEFLPSQAVMFLCLESLLGFVLPFIILSSCYCLVAVQLKKMTFRSKQKSRIVIHTLVIVFMLCWLPYHIVNIVDLACILRSDTDRECVPQSVIFSSGALVFISSSVNPLLYCFFARNFRGSLKESCLVGLFQELVTHTNKLRELAMQFQTGQGAASTQREEVSDTPC